MTLSNYDAWKLQTPPEYEREGACTEEEEEAERAAEAERYEQAMEEKAEAMRERMREGDW